MRLLDLIAGARPNFVKLAPVERALRAVPDLETRVVHTGQHYDVAMNEVFFRQLGIPEPDLCLGVGSGSHGTQTARILEGYERILLEGPPDAVVVFGDVNSTVACALAAVKLGVPVVHVEAGLRSFDRSMPEEVNRVLTDAMADLLLVSEASGVENLRREGVAADRIRLIGNVMIDTLVRELATVDRESVARLGLAPQGYGLVTLHRPSNVDDPATLERLLTLLGELSGRIPLVFPMHPRTAAAIAQADLGGLVERPGLRCMPPLGYRENLAVMESARLVLTDSGGMQEESSFLRVPCLTLRDNTERPVTVSSGTSRLVGNDSERIQAAFTDVLDGRWPPGEAIPLWDGAAADRAAFEVGNWVRTRDRVR